MVEKTKKNYFDNLDIKKITKTKTFCKNVSNTLLGIKLKNITLVQNEESFTKGKEIPENLKAFFEVAVKNMMQFTVRSFNSPY